jgi:hypothetical protein
MEMRQRRNLRAGWIYAAAAMAAAAVTTPALATNLLLNPGFEAGTGTATVSGWTLVFDAQRANFFNNTPGGQWSLWAKTWEPAGGGAFQDITGVTPGTNYSLTSKVYFENNYNQSTATIQLGLTFMDSGGNQVGSPFFTNIDPTSNPPTGTWTNQMVSGLAPAGASKVEVFLGWSGGFDVHMAQSVFFDDADLEGIGTPPTASEWNPNASGDWNSSGNWKNGSVPNSAGAEADFFSAITSNHTVFTDTAVTAGILNFNNANTYVIGGSGSLSMQVNTGSAQIIVQQGTHKINLPLTLASDTVANVSAGGTLIIGNPVTIAAGKTLTKNGNVLVQAPLTVQSAGVFLLNSGTTTLFSAPSLASGAKVDTKTNDLTIDYRGQSSPAATIQTQLKNGFGTGSWNSPGITTSSATTNTGLGWKDNSSAQNILIRYTYYGDTDLNKTVDLTDFTFLAANFNQSGKTWGQGDFNYNGTVDLTDFTFLAANFNKTLPAESAGLGAAVPEPTTMTLGIGGLMLAGLRRRSRTN